MLFESDLEPTVGYKMINEGGVNEGLFSKIARWFPHTKVRFLMTTV